MSNAKFTYFLSDANVDLYATYQQGLSNALQRFAVDKVISTTIETKTKENIYVICALNQEQHTIAGIRLEIKTGASKLPIEKCDVAQKKIIQYRVDQYCQNHKAVAELSGLWVAPENKGSKIGERLVLEATELALGLGICTILAMPPQHTINYFTHLGFVPDNEIPALAYPDDRYISRVVVYMNPDQSQKIKENLNNGVIELIQSRSLLR
jgi:GNAT superfamily N-acetyltransferase